MGHTHTHSHSVFDPVHAAWQSELYGLPNGMEDSTAVVEAKRGLDYGALGKAFTRQLRYREAATAFSLELDDMGETLEILRLRAGKYLATMQLDRARQDFLRCARLGADEVDIGYRLGLCEFYAGNYEKAMEYFADTLPIADDEMGIAILYWHTMAAYHAGATPALLEHYHAGMHVGHHTGYEKAMRLCAGAESVPGALVSLCAETEDLEFSIVAYGVAQHLLQTGMEQEGKRLLEIIRKRDGFWISFAFLAAVRDCPGAEPAAG